MGLKEDFYEDSNTLPNYFSFPCTFNCVSAQLQLSTENTATDFVRGDHKDTKKEMAKNLHGINFNQSSSLLNSNHQPLVTSNLEKHLPPALDPAPKLDSPLDTNSKHYVNQKASSIVEAKGYSTDITTRDYSIM